MNSTEVNNTKIRTFHTGLPNLDMGKGLPDIYLKFEGQEGYSRVDITLFVNENNRIMTRVVLAGESIREALRRINAKVEDVYRVIVAYDNYESIINPRIATYTNHMYAH